MALPLHLQRFSSSSSPSSSSSSHPLLHCSPPPSAPATKQTVVRERDLLLSLVKLTARALERGGEGRSARHDYLLVPVVQSSASQWVCRPIEVVTFSTHVPPQQQQHRSQATATTAASRTPLSCRLVVVVTRLHSAARHQHKPSVMSAVSRSVNSHDPTERGGFSRLPVLSLMYISRVVCWLTF